MKVLIQRVTKASVTIEKAERREIAHGMVVLVGISVEDNETDIAYLTKKLLALRIFDDSEGVMNRSIREVEGEILLVSQFTLMADTRKGNRPSYIHAAPPAISLPLYHRLIASLQESWEGRLVTGEFGTDMLVEIHNSGPVTILIDSKNK